MSVVAGFSRSISRWDSTIQGQPPPTQPPRSKDVPRALPSNHPPQLFANREGIVLIWFSIPPDANQPITCGKVGRICERLFASVDLVRRQQPQNRIKCGWRKSRDDAGGVGERPDAIVSLVNFRDGEI